MVFAGDFHRIGKAAQTEFFKPCFIDVQRLETVTDMLTGNLGSAVNLHCLTDRFRSPHRADHAPVVEYLTDTVAVAFAEALVIDVFANVVM